MKHLFFILSLVTGCSSCSLDDLYFEPRKTEAYTLRETVIPRAKTEEVQFSSNSETLYGVFVKPKNTSFDSHTKTILYVHGDDKDIDKFWHRIEYLYPLDMNLFIFDFQGYGRSTGKPSLKAIRQNTRDALTYLKSRSDVNSGKIIYYAFSLGGIFASDLAANTEAPLALITENIPASSNAMVRATLGIGIPSSFFFNETFDNITHLRKVSAPKLMMHSTQDETVPYEANAPAVFDAGPQPKTSLSVKNAGHSNLIESLGAEEYLKVIENFLETNAL